MQHLLCFNNYIIYIYINLQLKLHIYALLSEKLASDHSTEGCPHIFNVNYGCNILYLKLLRPSWRRPTATVFTLLLQVNKKKKTFDTIKVNRDGKSLISAIVEMFAWWKPDEISSEVTVSQLNIYFCVWKPSTHFACKRTLKYDFNCACYKRQKSDKFQGGVYVFVVFFLNLKHGPFKGPSWGGCWFGFTMKTDTGARFWIRLHLITVKGPQLLHHFTA